MSEPDNTALSELRRDIFQCPSGSAGHLPRVCGPGRHDRDGRLDFLLMSQLTATSFPLFLCGNHGDGTFDNLSAGLPQLASDTVLWGDCDSDGALDFLVAGNTRSGTSSRLYPNNNPRRNHPPTAPANLLVDTGANTVTFRWSGATDRDSAVPNLSHDLWAGKTPAGPDSIAPLAQTNGNRLVAQPRQHGRLAEATLTHLEPGNHYWNVQTIVVPATPWKRR